MFSESVQTISSFVFRLPVQKQSECFYLLCSLKLLTFSPDCQKCLLLKMSLKEKQNIMRKIDVKCFLIQQKAQTYYSIAAMFTLLSVREKPIILALTDKSCQKRSKLVRLLSQQQLKSLIYTAIKLELAVYFPVFLKRVLCSLFQKGQSNQLKTLSDMLSLRYRYSHLLIMQYSKNIHSQNNRTRILSSSGYLCSMFCLVLLIELI